MTAHRFLFYLPDLAEGDVNIDIADKENHHLSRVLRAVRGDTVFVTNGSGLLVEALIENLEREKCTARIERVVAEARPRRRVTLALGMLRKPAFERAVEMCVEAGITECVPFVAAQSHVSTYPAVFLERLRRVAVSAMKQSFRSVLPDVVAPEHFDGIVDRCRYAAHAVIGDEDGAHVPPPPADRDVIVIVGPEAGLASLERDQLVAANAVPASVSPHRLRAETAALALVAHVVRGSD